VNTNFFQSDTLVGLYRVLQLNAFQRAENNLIVSVISITNNAEITPNPNLLLIFNTNTQEFDDGFEQIYTHQNRFGFNGGHGKKFLKQLEESKNNRLWRRGSDKQKKEQEAKDKRN
jgi:hypothetical protein